MPSVYLYAISHDLGFAPNPFGGLCTLACCKPNIRERAKHGDWIIGLTGTKLAPAMRCVFAMVVTGDMTFEAYWDHPEFAFRRPKRNGSDKKLVGDNIYHRNAAQETWMQEDSVHSLSHGAQCPLNTAHDTRVNRVLLSRRFVYFGAAAPRLPDAVRDAMSYQKNSRDYRRFDIADAGPILTWLASQMEARSNAVLADPINLDVAFKRYSAALLRVA